MDNERYLNISYEELENWGVLEKVKREKEKDKIIVNSEYPSSELIKSIEKEWKKEYNLQDEKKFRIWLSSSNLNEKKFLSLIVRNWIWKEWCKEKFKDKLYDYFLSRKSKLERVIYSLIRVKDRNVANELYMRIKENEEPFWKIAKDYSDGPEKYTEGRIGPIRMSDLNPYIYKLLEISELGQLWPPKKLDEWWIILKLERRIKLDLNEGVKNNLFLELGENYLKEIIINKRE